MIVDIPKKGADSKLIIAINAMIRNKDQISNVQRNKQTYVFSYKDTYTWSIFYSEPNDDYYLTYYNTGDVSSVVHNLAAGKPLDAISYSDSDYKTREATESFSELYTIVKEKLYDMDSVLDDIIKDF